jgi:hypothetical protein
MGYVKMLKRRIGMLGSSYFRLHKNKLDRKL